MEKEKVDPKKVRCLVCDTVGEWKNVDHLKLTKTGLSICQKCGFATHIDNLVSKEKLKAYYKKDYRQPPSAANFFTGQRKLHYHQAFLGDLLQEWAKEKKDITVFDSGAAYGMLLKWLKDYYAHFGGKAEVYGSEWTESFKNVSMNHHAIELLDEIDETKKHDLITSYKVAEHQMDADKEIRKFVECLSDDGLIYIGVPTWFKAMTNFGIGGFDIEYYYHKDHINVWTEKLFRQVLKKAGLEILKENHVYYDSVYLCKRNDDLMKEELEFEDPADIEARMEKIKKASDFQVEANFKKAIEEWSNFPIAWINNYEKNRQAFDKLGFEGILEKHIDLAMKACPNNADIVMHVADIYDRYQKYPEAIRLLDKAFEMRPGNAGILMKRGQILTVLADSLPEGEEKIKLFTEARGTFIRASQLSEQTKYDCLNWIYRLESLIPPQEIRT